MKKMLSMLTLCLLLATTGVQAQSYFPDEVTVKEHWISYTKSYDIETKTNKLGTLYKRFFSFRLTYDFYDPMNVKTATAKARFFSFGAHLDIYDSNNAVLGSVEEKIFTFFPTFEVIAPDSSTKLARAEMNFWGTKFYIYDPATKQEMAVMSRPFFRLKNDWTIQITNRGLFDQKNIDQRVLMTVLAVQGEIEDWKRDQRDNDNAKMSSKPATADANAKIYDEVTQQINALSTDVSVNLDTEESQNRLEALANELEQQFDAEHPVNGADGQNADKRLKEFTTFCLNKMKTQDMSESKKQLIATLLKLRLQGHS